MRMSGAVTLLLAIGFAACSDTQTPPTGTLGISPASLAFTAPQGTTNPASQVLEITEAGAELVWSASDNAAWLTLTPSSGNAPTTVTVSAAVAGMAVGTHSATITVTSNGAANSPQTVAVTLTVTAGP